MPLFFPEPSPLRVAGRDPAGAGSLQTTHANVDDPRLFAEARGATPRRVRLFYSTGDPT